MQDNLVKLIEDGGRISIVQESKYHYQFPLGYSVTGRNGTYSFTSASIEESVAKALIYITNNPIKKNN